jgi:hypothetical protein
MEGEGGIGKLNDFGGCVVLCCVIPMFAAFYLLDWILEI